MNTFETKATPKMYVSAYGNKINILGLMKDAQDSISLVETIYAPGQVTMRRNRDSDRRYPVPSVAEIVGGSTPHNFCQVVADIGGKPVQINSILYVNRDPANSGISYSSAQITVGMMLGLGCMTLGSGMAFLYYEVVGLSAYPIPENATQKTINELESVSKLTLSLVGADIKTWNKQLIDDVPRHLSALHAATKARLTSNIRVPLYMDVIRTVKIAPEDTLFANRIINNEFPTEHIEIFTTDSTLSTFMLEVLNQAVDIRNTQYANIADGSPRHTDSLRGIELLTAREDGAVDISLTFGRKDYSPTTLTTTLTRDNFFSYDGRLSLDRGLLLNGGSFDQFRNSLLQKIRNDKCRDNTLAVCVTSLR